MARERNGMGINGKDGVMAGSKEDLMRRVDDNR